MVNLFTFALVASVLSLAAANKQGPIGTEEIVLVPQLQPVNKPSPTTTGLSLDNPQSGPVLEKRDLINNLPIISQLLPTSTRSPTERFEQRTSSRFSFKKIRVHSYLVDTLNAILPHTAIIRKLCTGAVNVDPNQLSWQLVQELQAILDILNGCISKVRDCGKAPTPSGTPGGTPGGNPINLDDICQIIFKIMCEIRECCKLIGALCIKYKVVRRGCQVTLTQITSCLSSLAIKCGVQVGDLTTGLGRHFATVPNFFGGIQFGFSGIPSVLGGGAYFSFGASL